MPGPSFKISETIISALIFTQSQNLTEGYQDMEHFSDQRITEAINWIVRFVAEEGENNEGEVDYQKLVYPWTDDSDSEPSQG